MNPTPPPDDPEVTRVRPPDERPQIPHPAGDAPTADSPLLHQFPFLDPPAPEHPEGGRLGPYRIIRLLGGGGMGVVFEAVDDALQRPVALKIRRPERADENDRARFLREAQTAAAIKSDNVITIHQVGEAKGVQYIAMELLHGQNLSDWLEGRAVTAPDVVRVAKGVLEGLAAVHEKGLIHRDIKPANLWVELPNGRLKLLDFGLTRGPQTSITDTGELVGTPAYMAPEQIRGEEPEARSDLFSLGVVLYRMATGGNPFHKTNNVSATLDAVKTFEPPPVEKCGVVSGALAQLIDRLISKDPGARPASAKDALKVVHLAERQLRAAERPVPNTGAAPAPVHPPVGDEVEEEFDFVVEAGPRTGTRCVLDVDLGAGQSMTFVRIPKGHFWMGAAGAEERARDDEQPQRRIDFDRDFFLGMYPVTQAQYAALGGDLRARFRGPLLPVDSVSWDDAVAFCARLSNRTGLTLDLPTEAEWEYACRAGTATPFHFGSVLDGTAANCDGSAPYGCSAPGPTRLATSAVGSYPANPWGLYDLHGNVWEWCRDYYGHYDRVPGATDPVQLALQSENCRVLRGGSWASDAAMCRAAARIRNAPEARGYSYGFRVCLRPAV
jgi:formylglycine-generating enzyme required for sulfatase activity/tRNA A-37 threonylcarbamoyl transferase component Bud32